MAKRHITKKCYLCKQEIPVDRQDIKGIIYYNKHYYHMDCFCDHANKRVESGAHNAAEWQHALDTIGDLEKETKVIVNSRTAYRDSKDSLNDYLLEQYDFVDFPKRFWQVIVDLSNGIYKGKRCKKVSIDILLETWKWGQSKLDEINRYNIANHKGPENDQDRLAYDLAIIVKKIPNYLAYKAKKEAAEAERQMRCKEEIKVDYSKIKTTKVTSGLGDINDLLDELI
jgi:hypothetical protein